MTKPFDAPSFITFVASKDAGERYSTGCRHCALAQFGVIVPTVSGIIAEEQWGIPRAVFTAAVHETPRTFGALLQRLKALS